MSTWRKLRNVLLVGLVAGFLWLSIFGVAHAFLITPIWRNLLGLIPFAIIAGCVTAFAFQELRNAGKLYLTLRSGALYGLLLWLMLLPMTLFAAGLRLTGMRQIFVEWETVAEIVIAFTTGALLGWLLTRRWRLALSLGITMLVLVVVMGGPIPIFNSTRAAYLFISFLIIYMICGISLSVIFGVFEKHEHGSNVQLSGE